MDEKELVFFRKLHSEIEMVNKWYLEKITECKQRVKDYEAQVLFGLTLSLYQGIPLLRSTRQEVDHPQFSSVQPAGIRSERTLSNPGLPP